MTDTNRRRYRRKLFARLKRDFPVAGNASIGEQVTSEIDGWDRAIPRRLIRENPYGGNQEALEAAEADLKRGACTIEAIEGDSSDYQRLAEQTKSTIDKAFWRSQIDAARSAEERALSQPPAKAEEESPRQEGQPQESQPHPDEESQREGQPKDAESLHLQQEERQTERKVLRRLLQQKWRKLYDTAYNRWELETIAGWRRELLQRLEEWLQTLQKLNDALSQLSIEPGLLFDLSKGGLSLSDIEQLKRWADYVANDPGVQRLCDMLGRLRRAARSSRQALAKSTATIPRHIPEINSRGEIIGVTLDNRIDYALPHELALLADDETSILFDMKYVERRLMCFEMMDWRTESQQIEREAMQEIEEEENLGPIILCIDTSGSMQGAPETVAKAVALFMAMRAIKQKRDCFLINFSERIETLDLSDSMGIAEAIRFLRRSFHGGTDPTPALAHAIKLMNKERYGRADLLMTSDFVMGTDLLKELQGSILQAKASGNRFYSLSIGDFSLEGNCEESSTTSGSTVRRAAE